jgi:hypothetical protein
MPQRKAFSAYYTAGEVKKLLGITDGQLYNYVRYGHLERVIPPGRKQGVYRKEEVDKFALEMSAFLGSREDTKNTVFTRVAKEDVDATLAATREIFKTNPSRDIRMSWVEKNPDVSYQLCLNGSVIGVATLLPVRPEWIEMILTDKVWSEDTPAEEVEVYEPGKRYHIYAMGFGVLPVFSKLEKRLYGSKLIRGIGGAIIDLGNRGIDIATITARSHTYDGIHLLRHLGFKQIPSVTSEVNFRIDLSESEIPLARSYREALLNATNKPRPRKKTVQKAG